LTFRLFSRPIPLLTIKGVSSPILRQIVSRSAPVDAMRLRRKLNGRRAVVGLDNLYVRRVRLQEGANRF